MTVTDMSHMSHLWLQIHMICQKDDVIHHIR